MHINTHKYYNSIVNNRWANGFHCEKNYIESENCKSTLNISENTKRNCYNKNITGLGCCWLTCKECSFAITFPHFIQKGKTKSEINKSTITLQLTIKLHCKLNIQLHCTLTVQSHNNTTTNYKITLQTKYTITLHTNCTITQ